MLQDVFEMRYARIPDEPIPSAGGDKGSSEESESEESPSESSSESEDSEDERERQLQTLQDQVKKCHFISSSILPSGGEHRVRTGA